MLMSGFRNICCACMLMFGILPASAQESRQLNIPFCYSYFKESISYMLRDDAIDREWGLRNQSELEAKERQLKRLWLRYERGRSWPNLSPDDAWASATALGILRLSLDVDNDRSRFLRTMQSCQPVIRRAMDIVAGD